jgi:hypothetical protein
VKDVGWNRWISDGGKCDPFQRLEVEIL